MRLWAAFVVSGLAMVAVAAPAPEPTPAPKPAADAAAAGEDVLKIDGGYEIVFDTKEMPELKEWVDKKLKPTCAQWYPKIVEMLPSEGFTAPKRFTIQFLKDMRGVANASGTKIRCGGQWFKGQTEREGPGAVVHEMVHIVQQYGQARGGNRNPGWLVEGLADYIRWHLYEPKEKRRKLDPAKVKYTDSYHVTGAFLEYVVNTYDKDFVKKLNATMRQGKYTPEFWKEQTGKTIDDLWAEFVKTLPPKQ
jgi:hypothetical protein